MNNKECCDKGMIITEADIDFFAALRRCGGNDGDKKVRKKSEHLSLNQWLELTQSQIRVLKSLSIEELRTWYDIEDNKDKIEYLKDRSCEQ